MLRASADVMTRDLFRGLRGWARFSCVGFMFVSEMRDAEDAGLTGLVGESGFGRCAG